MAEGAGASQIPPGRYSKRLGNSPGGTDAAGVSLGGAAGAGGAASAAGAASAGGAGSAAGAAAGGLAGGTAGAAGGGSGSGGSAGVTGSMASPSSFSIRNFLAVFKYSRRALELVWSTNKFLAIVLALLTVVAGALPAGVAYVGSLIVDAVVAAIRAGGIDGTRVIELVVLEGVLIAGIAAAQRGLSLCQWLLRAQLGQRVNVMILEKALTLDLRHFEDSEFYDKLTRARREASSRPLSLVIRTFGLVQNGISLISLGTLLVQFSPWAVAILLLAGLPAFIAEAKFSGDAFSLFRWRSPDTRMQMYLETVLARDEHAKEVKLYNLGDRFLDRYQSIFKKLYTADRALAIKRDVWGFGLGLVATVALYGAYAWIAVSTVHGLITLGQMTMYVMLFRQGQSAVTASLSAVGGMYEDNLYLSTLYEYLETDVSPPAGDAKRGPHPEDGVRFENVGFTYPGASEPALEGVSLHLKPGNSLALVG
jgi:ATP-binding cassette subfamily B protein